ncbi:MAG: hypothetical protein ACYDEX_23165 [Mobilitalea sp.]
MKKLVSKVSKLSSNSCLAVLSLAVTALFGWGTGCCLLFFEPQEPEALQSLNLKELRKEL